MNQGRFYKKLTSFYEWVLFCEGKEIFFLYEG